MPGAGQEVELFGGGARQGGAGRGRGQAHSSKVRLVLDPGLCSVGVWCVNSPWGFHMNTCLRTENVQVNP